MAAIGKFYYPDLSIDECADLVKVINSAFQGETSRDSLAAKLGHSANSGRFSSKLSALRQFGLIEGHGTIRLTDPGASLAQASDAQERRAWKFQAILKVPIIRQLYDRFNASGVEAGALADSLQTITGLGRSDVERATPSLRRHLDDVTARYAYTKAQTRSPGVRNAIEPVIDQSGNAPFFRPPAPYPMQDLFNTTVDHISPQLAVDTAGPAFWNKVALWGIERNMLAPEEMDVLRLISKGQHPSVQQCAMLLKTLERLQNAGCPLTLDVEDEGFGAEVPKARKDSTLTAALDADPPPTEDTNLGMIRIEVQAAILNAPFTSQGVRMAQAFLASLSPSE